MGFGGNSVGIGISSVVLDSLFDILSVFVTRKLLLVCVSPAMPAVDVLLLLDACKYV